MNLDRSLILVAPDDSTRVELQQAIDAAGSVRLVGTCGEYAGAVALASRSGCELAVVCLDGGREHGLEAIRRLRAEVPAAAVLPASRSRDGETILAALRAGAQEFLPLPADPAELRTIVSRLLPDRPAPVATEGRLVAVTGAAGGVGCTTLAVNLACALAKAPDVSVALVDLDLLLGAVDTALDVMAEHSIVDVVAEVERLDATLLRRALVRHASGVHVLPAPPAMQDAARVDPDSTRTVLEMLKCAFTYVVVDTSKGFQATDFIAFELAESILMVSQLDVPGLRNGTRLIQLMRECDGLADRVQVVLNRTGSDSSAVGPKKAEETLGVPVKWQVPNASKIIASARSRGVTLDAEAPGCPAARAIRELAASFEPSLRDPETKAKFRRFAAMFT